MQKSDWLGIFCITFWLVTFFTLTLFLNFHYLVWFSNHTFLILGIALLLKNRWLLCTQLCLGAIPELTWSTDYLFRAITGNSLWGFTNYMFTSAGGFNLVHFYSLSHLLFVPLTLLGLWMLSGSVVRAYLGSLAHMLVLWPLSFLFGSDYNLNCVYYDCGIFTWLPAYQLTWPLVIIANVMLVYGVVLFASKKIS